MRENPRFRVELDDLITALDAQPLAWIQATSAPTLASPLPLFAVKVEYGVELHGHFARNNPLVSTLAQHPGVQVCWIGLSGYQSPAWLRDRSQAPTFLYCAAQCTGELQLLDTPAEIERSVVELTARMERTSASPGVRPWDTAELGPRRSPLLGAIVAFRIPVSALQVQFKLGQNERADVFDDACRGFARQGAVTLAQNMRRYRRDLA